MLGTLLALGTFAVALGVAGIAGAVGGTPAFSLWTNVLFLWPTVRALALRAYSEAAVFTVTGFVSLAHHACVADGGVRAGLAPSFFVLAGLGGAVIIVAATVVVWQNVDILPDDGVDVEWRWRARACTGLAAGAALVSLAGSVIVAAATGLDGCLYAGPHVPALVTLWRTVDFTAALAALVAVTAHGIQLGTRFELGAFWAVLALATLVNAYVAAGLAPAGTTYAILGGALAALLLVRLAACGAVPTHVARAAFRRYSLGDTIAAVLVAAAALTLFLVHNTEATHGWWHALAALALYLVMDAVTSIRAERVARL